MELIINSTLQKFEWLRTYLYIDFSIILKCVFLLHVCIVTVVETVCESKLVGMVIGEGTELLNATNGINFCVDVHMGYYPSPVHVCTLGPPLSSPLWRS
jgi:hypothetical protein